MCLLLKTLNFINQLIRLLQYIERAPYIKTCTSSNMIPTSIRATNKT